MSQFIYDGSHLGDGERDCMLQYANGVSVWVVYKNRTHHYEIQHNEKVIKEVDKFILVEMFLEGLKTFVDNKEEAFAKIELKQLPEDVVILQKELTKTVLELERTKKLAEKLIKGIIKNKTDKLGVELTGQVNAVIR